MDNRTFDDFARSMTQSRRFILSAPLALTAGWAGLSASEAKNNGRNTPHPYGCREVGDACKRSGQCCSSICKGKPGKKTCRAHGTATCKQGVPGACTAGNPELLHCGSNSDCFCFRTTAGSNYCGDWFGGTKICHACTKDADCEALNLPPGSACVPVAMGNCAAANCEGGMMCMAPCGSEPPAQ